MNMGFRRAFEPAEFQRRVVLAKTCMAKAGFDLAPSQLARLTGFDGWSLYTRRPGVTCEEAEALWQSVLNRNSCEKMSRVGYSIGLNYPSDWGERTASLRAGDKTVLEAGMCFHF